MNWVRRTVNLNFSVSYRTLFSIKRVCLCKTITLDERPDREFFNNLPNFLDEDGYFIRSLPSNILEFEISKFGQYLSYIQKKYDHFYINMGTSFDEYQSTFSSKTRSTIRRKIRKFAQLSNNEINWRSFTTPSEMDEFFRQASVVSKVSYQERLLNAGLPTDKRFIQGAVRSSAKDALRAFILYDKDRPVSYLYCPVEEGTVIYAYLGYDPEYRNYSVGTILQWLALSYLFAEDRFRIFDFTEGESDHKRLFSTGYRSELNVLILQKSIGNRCLIYGHYWFNLAIERLGALTEKLKLKRILKRRLRGELP